MICPSRGEIDLADLPEDAQTLKALVQQLVGTVRIQGVKIAQLEARLAKLKRMQFGQSSEKRSHEIAQLELELGALHEEESSAAAERPAAVQKLIEKPYRKPLPDHLPREEGAHEPACACSNCGGALCKPGEDVTEVLDMCPSISQPIMAPSEQEGLEVRPVPWSSIGGRLTRTGAGSEAVGLYSFLDQFAGLTPEVLKHFNST